MDANIKVIRDAFKEQMPIWYDEVWVELDKLCRRNLLDAAIRNREGHPKSHQFTGNLINSIVVILFRRDTGEQANYFAYDDLRAPIRREMSARNQRGQMRRRAIHFRPDWDYTPHSKYKPEVVTDESLGPADARSFASSWSPSLNTPFEICVAYTSEYADWVETQRHTTGFLNTYQFTSKAMRVGLGLHKMNG